MTDAQETSHQQGYGINHKEGRERQDLAKITLAVLMAESLLKVWDANDAWSVDFKKVLSDALNAAYQQPNPEVLGKLRKLEEKLRAVGAAAETPVEERTSEEQKLVDDEHAAADADGDGVVSASEAMKRVYKLFIELELYDQAQWFLDRRAARSKN